MSEIVLSLWVMKLSTLFEEALKEASAHIAAEASELPFSLAYVIALFHIEEEIKEPESLLN